MSSGKRNFLTYSIKQRNLSLPSTFRSRPDIPLHANAMLKNARDGIHNAKEQLAELAKKGHQIAYVGDVVGTGSSRKSATIRSVINVSC